MIDIIFCIHYLKLFKNFIFKKVIVSTDNAYPILLFNTYSIKENYLVIKGFFSIKRVPVLSISFQFSSTNAYIVKLLLHNQ